jgi:hypothetical protein
MEDYNILWYILAAIIYFLTRSKKKKPTQSRPGTENNPAPQERPKTFEDLLKEITGEAVIEPDLAEPEEMISESQQTRQSPKEKAPLEEAKEQQRLEGERRAFADDESRRVYEESIKRAEGFKIEYEPDEHYAESRIFKGQGVEEEKEYTFADEIRDGLSSTEARKAIIYSEILSRKY